MPPKVKAASTIKKRISVLESYRKNCIERHKEATEQNNESAMNFYTSEQKVLQVRIKDLRWVIGKAE